MAKWVLWKIGANPEVSITLLPLSATTELVSEFNFFEIKSFVALASSARKPSPNFSTACKSFKAVIHGHLPSKMRGLKPSFVTVIPKSGSRISRSASIKLFKDKFYIGYFSLISCPLYFFIAAYNLVFLLILHPRLIFQNQVVQSKNS